MNTWAQLILAAAVAVGGVVVVAQQVPAARPFLERAGIWAALDAAGVTPSVTETAVAISPTGPGGPPAGAAGGARPGAGGPPGAGGSPAAGGRPGGGAPGGPPGGGRPGFGGPATVVASAPRIVPLVNDVAAIGTGVSRHAVAVRPEVSGRLSEVLVTSGQRVEAGQVLARLEDASEAIAVTRAQLLLSDAEAAFGRISRLQSSGSASELQLSTAELALRQAELGVQQAEFDLSRRTIRAPISGLTGIVELGVGDQVVPSDTLTRIDDRAQILVDFTVPERFVGQIALGSAVQATPLARPDLVLEGRIHAIENRVDAATRAIRLQAAIDNTDDALRAGMAFSIRMSFAGDSYPAVDPLAIQWSSGGAFVWVIREGQAVRVPVQIAQRSAAQVLLRAEFAPDDLVVTEGVQSLRPGGAATVRGAPVAGAPDAGAAAPTPQREG
jgi:RND family efflux transporter MFP subunit